MKFKIYKLLVNSSILSFPGILSILLSLISIPVHLSIAGVENYGNFIIFNQNLPHGNIVNVENETRWSINCRFKSFFSPYGDKKIGEFFVPITTKPMTELGLNYKSPLE